MSDTVFPAGGRALSVKALEEELKSVWKESMGGSGGSQVPAGATEPIMRAALLTFVAVVDGPAAAERMTGMVAQLTEQTPCRSLIVELDGAGETARSGSSPTEPPPTGGPAAAQPLAAFVSAHCHERPGSRPVCSEQITITSTPDGDPHLSNLVLPLLLPDLPVVLHWPGVASMMAPAGPGPHPLPRGAQFLCDLDPYVDEVLLDSTLAGNPEAYLSHVLALAERPTGPGMRPIDLNWVRLMPWREALADAVDRCAIDVTTIREARLEAVPGAEGTTAVRPRLLAGWLVDRLTEATGGAFRVRIEPVSAPPGPTAPAATTAPSATTAPAATTAPLPGRLVRVTLTLADGSLMTVQVEGGTLAVTHRHDSFRFNRPADDDDHLLCRVIERRGNDPWFARALRAAEQALVP